MAAHIYLDESGDPGWIFDQAYTHGGSSRYLVIAASLMHIDQEHKPERLVRQLYKYRKWNPRKEKKWAQMSKQARTDFAKSAANLLKATPQISDSAIVVNKQNVQPHARRDAHNLYNYMVKLLLLNEMAKHDRISFIPDARSVKVGSSNSLHDYLQTELWFTLNAHTLVETVPRDSQHCLNLQFTDMLAGVIHSHFEFGESQH
jgi:hypothetical protein